MVDTHSTYTVDVVDVHGNNTGWIQFGCTRQSCMIDIRMNASVLFKMYLTWHCTASLACPCSSAASSSGFLPETRKEKTALLSMVKEKLMVNLSFPLA